MISITSLYVRAGDLIIPAWRRLVEGIASLPVLPGVGVLLTSTPRGTIVNSRAAVVGFSGAWSMGTPSGGALEIGDGYCNAKVPTIEGKPLIPNVAPRPPLKLKEALFDKSGRSWVCLEAEVDASGKPIAKDPFRLVQAAHPYFTDKKEIGRAPIAVLFRGQAKSGLGQLHRIAYHDLQHRFDGKRHLFFI